MFEAAIPFPSFNPIAFAIGPVPVRWYGLAYLAGLLLGWLYMRALLSNHRLWPRATPPMVPDRADDFLLWVTLGVVIGGRLGFILLYEPSHFLAHPAQIFALWHGGMAFHGGLLGVGLAIWLFARSHQVPILSLMDISAAAVPFGLFFGRIANFINGEIYGRLTSVPWAVEFPARVLLPGDALGPRHPTQLYEAFLEGIVLFILLRLFTHRLGALARPGLTTGVFLIAYGAARIFAEFFKQWDYQQFFTSQYFSTGMVYSLPMIALGIYLCMQARQKAPLPAQ